MNNLPMLYKGDSEIRMPLVLLFFILSGALALAMLTDDSEPVLVATPVVETYKQEINYFVNDDTGRYTLFEAICYIENGKANNPACITDICMQDLQRMGYSFTWADVPSNLDQMFDFYTDNYIKVYGLVDTPYNRACIWRWGPRGWENPRTDYPERVVNIMGTYKERD